jgi:hypothetical protein
MLIIVTPPEAMTIEQAEHIMASGNGIVDGFPVHDGREVYCEFNEWDGGKTE